MMNETKLAHEEFHNPAVRDSVTPIRSAEKIAPECSQPTDNDYNPGLPIIALAHKGCNNKHGAQKNTRECS